MGNLQARGVHDGPPHTSTSPVPLPGHFVSQKEAPVLGPGETQLQWEEVLPLCGGDAVILGAAAEKS